MTQLSTNLGLTTYNTVTDASSILLLSWVDQISGCPAPKNLGIIDRFAGETSGSLRGLSGCSVDISASLVRASGSLTGLSASVVTLFQQDTTGWIGVPNTTWSYASASSINVPVSASSTFAIGDKIKFNQLGVVKYFYIVSTAAASIGLVSASSVTVSIGDTITSGCYSKVSPPDFPASMEWSGTGGFNPIGFAGSPIVTDYTRFWIDGRNISLRVYTGGSSAGNILYGTLPVRSMVQPSMVHCQTNTTYVFGWANSGSQSLTTSYSPSASIVNLYTSASYAGWNATGSKVASALVTAIIP